MAGQYGPAAGGAAARASLGFAKDQRAGSTPPLQAEQPRGTTSETGEEAREGCATTNTLTGFNQCHLLPPLDAACFYANYGWAVFPTKLIRRPNGRIDKIPCIKDWGNGATRDPLQLSAWWRRWPDAVVSMPTGKRNGVIILDVDIKDGRNGFDRLDELDKPILPDTPISHTVSGGVHIHFGYNGAIGIRNSAGEKGLGLGLDVRGEGGQVVLPSANSGYRWDPCQNYDTVGLFPAPSWLGHREKCERRYQTDTRRWTPHSILEEACANIRTAADGSKHDILNREVYFVATLAAASALEQSEAHHALRIATAALIAHSGCNAEQTWKFFHKAWSDGLAAPRRLRTGSTRR